MTYQDNPMTNDALKYLPRRNLLTVLESADDQEWLNHRRSGLGGSDVAVVLGLSPWTTPVALWRQKVGLDPDTFSSPSMAEGTAMEPVIAQEFQEDNCIEFLKMPMLQDREHPHRLANLDGIGVLPDGSACVVEIKWSARGFQGGAIPVQYVCQVLWYMAITGLTDRPGLLVVRNPGKRPEVTQIQWDEEAAHEMTIAVDQWWEQHVIGGEPPQPSNDDERVAVALGRVGIGLPTIRADEAMDRTILDMLEAEAIVKAEEAKIKAAKARLAEAMAEAGASKIESMSGWAATLVERKGSIKYGEVAKALKIPEETLEQYRGQASRYVRFTQAKEN